MTNKLNLLYFWLAISADKGLERLILTNTRIGPHTRENMLMLNLAAARGD
jgi:hypothetical protein